MVNAITGSEAAAYADRLRDFFPNFKTAFGPEYAERPSLFVPRERAYYVVSHHNRAEALVAVTFNAGNNPEEAMISFARLVLKDRYAADGWWYVYEVLNHAVRPRGVHIVQAHLDTKGSLKACNDLHAEYPTAVNIFGSLGVVDLDMLPLSAE